MSVGSLYGERRLLRQGPLEWISTWQVGLHMSTTFLLNFQYFNAEPSGGGTLPCLILKHLSKFLYPPPGYHVSCPWFIFLENPFLSSVLTQLQFWEEQSMEDVLFCWEHSEQGDVADSFGRGKVEGCHLRGSKTELGLNGAADSNEVYLKSQLHFRNIENWSKI